MYTIKTLQITFCEINEENFKKKLEFNQSKHTVQHSVKHVSESRIGLIKKVTLQEMTQ